MSALERELSLPELIAALPEEEQLAAVRLDPARRRIGEGAQLASELLGPYQKGKRVTSRMRRRAKRVAALNHDTTREVVIDGQKRGSVKVDEMPLGGDLIQPKWLKRGERLTDGQQHEVVRYRMVDGERVRITSTDAERSAAAERMLRAQAYQLNAGSDPTKLMVAHYHESDANHRSNVVNLVDDPATSAKAVRKNATRAYGEVCPITFVKDEKTGKMVQHGCGLMHRGTCEME